MRQSTEEFIVTGINYKKTDAVVRGRFAINNEQYATLLASASKYGVSDLFIVSTCNRTEVYGFATSPRCFADLICSVCEGDTDTFASMAYVKKGDSAVTHLYQVASGLDSQILGDYEILGQIKNAAKLAKNAGFIGQYLERLLNSVLQASKAVKTNTALSGGTVSVSFAAVQCMKEYAEQKGIIPAELKVALIGTGKIGRVTCRNVIDYLHTRAITLVNRTEATAQALASELHIHCVPLEQLGDAVSNADVVLVSTNAGKAIINACHVAGKGKKLIIDISVPCNVSEEAQALPDITFVNVDQLAKIKDETLQKRSAEIPKALAIIDEHRKEFNDWCEMRRHVPVIRDMKHKLLAIPFHPLHRNAFNTVAENKQEEKVQKVLNNLAINIRNGNTPGCYYIQAINEYIA